MPSLVPVVLAAVDELTDELVAIRRDLHAHPEVAWQEERTTTLVAKRLEEAGLSLQLLPKSGLVAEVGSRGGPVVALRADLDALAVDDLTVDPWQSVYDGVAHACGHDVHTAALVGAGLGLAAVHAETPLPGRVRLLFQPAEEVMPGGALEMISTGALDDVRNVFGLHCDPGLDVGQIGLREGPLTGALDDVRNVFGLHCDPGLDVGQIGLREGPLTGAADSMTVRLSGRGGHTSRPHLTQDLTYALATLVTQLPAALSRRLDPRAGASLVWGIVRAGSAKNVIPSSGEAAGTVRMLDAVAWAEAEALIRELIRQIVEPYGVDAEVDYVRGVPPVVNEVASTQILGHAAEVVVGKDSHVYTPQSLGGEDFAWYLESVPGAMARLGTRTPGGPTYDLHQGDLRVDEGATPIGAKVLATAALEALIAARPGRRSHAHGPEVTDV